MENPASCLIDNVNAYFVTEPNSRKRQRKSVSLIRMQSDRLTEFGDITFPVSLSTWENFYGHQHIGIKEEAFQIFEQNSEKASQRRREFLAASALWPTFPIERLVIHKERCALHLQRHAVIGHVLRQVLAQDAPYFHVEKNSARLLQIQHAAAAEEDDLSHYRAALIGSTLRRILRYTDWTVVMVDATEHHADAAGQLLLSVQSVAANEANTAGRAVTVKCGIVCDPKSGKRAKVETQEYLKLRANDMQLMAMHKYGIRVRDDRRFCALMERLGAAAVSVDLLEAKHSSPVQINRNGQGSTKGASFFMYNSARLETLLRSFEARVQSASYAQLPSIDSVDMTLLNEEEEWQLIYGYILTFPQLIERSVEQLDRGVCGTHAIVRYVNSLVAIFSVYYRRIRILTDTREHLMPRVYARIYLLKALREVLNRTLALLDIEPVAFM